jgi:uncharacterized protein YxjI
MNQSEHPEAWHPDPSKRHQMRYWDGTEWTSHVSNNGKTTIDKDGQAMSNSGQSASAGFIDGEMFGYTTPEQVQAQVAKAQTSSAKDSILSSIEVPNPSATDVPPPSYDQSIFTENILVVNQKAKLLELTAEYGIYDQNGNQIGAVRQVGQSALKKAARAFTNLDSMMTHTLDIVDMSGNLKLRIVKPRALIKPRVIVQNSQGQELGELVIKLRIGKAQIKMLVNGNQVGMIYAENFRAWNFAIHDVNENRIASITKTWEGFTKAMFTTADNYVVQIHQELQDPIHSMVLAGSLAVDLILKQDSSGGLPF